MKNGADYNIIVDVPENAHICTDGRVYVVTEKRYFEDLRYNIDKRAWLGKAINPTQMHPNNNYKDMFADKLQNVPHLNLPVYSKRIGLYASALSIGTRTGLYPDLVTFLGSCRANLVMDYAVYSILTKSNAAKDFQTEVSDQMLFFGKPYSDTWIHNQIDTVITSDQVQAFKNAWVKHFSKDALSEVWICIDGQAIKEMIVALKGYGISPRGVILDRGFCDEGCIQLLKKTVMITSL